MIVKLKIVKIIGKTFADSLDEVLFQSGNWGYTRRQMVENLGCANFNASVRLAKTLQRLKIDSPLKLYRLDPGSLARTRGVGASSLFVAMCILEAHGYDILKWWKTDRAKFATIKHQTMRKATKHKQAV